MNKLFFFLVLLNLNTFAKNFETRSNQITVSGISSGAFFAHQFHLIYNENVNGAALFAGGPFYCAKGSFQVGLSRCMQGKRSYNLADESLKLLRKLSKERKVDSLANIKNDRVFIFTGLLDTVAYPSVPFQLKRLYHLLGLNNTSVRMIDDMKAGHTYPTVNFGNTCETVGASPFISSCNYDGAMESLTYLHPLNKVRKDVARGELLTIDQKKYFKEKSKPLMQDSAYLYIPKFCKDGGKCDFHVAFHGCSQTVDHIDMQFVKKTGITEAADKLNLVVLFPQAKKATLPGRNPFGCWDWWGHSGADYHTKKGQQISIVKRMVADLTGISFN
ncbi:hypothetical protein A9Q84_15320 [Halobacteriovorax marinus]|uniref:Poly (3-hydroxybutyrate) depolymerase n=1 Tax=Halobacteriovorax marinus TaxID=97084 RepID=A0A1Y5F5D0_9BACT|nr:hypothetical protein A9Q84_15320 [Halobacteriovorax marinus]